MKDIKINKLQCKQNHGDMKCTKIQQTKTAEPTESPETKSKRRSKKRKLTSKEKFYLQKTAKKFGR